MEWYHPSSIPNCKSPKKLSQQKCPPTIRTALSTRRDLKHTQFYKSSLLLSQGATELPQETNAPVSKQIFSACTHAAYYFLIVWYASSYRIAYVKGNTDICSAKKTNQLLFGTNTVKVNSSNCGFNSAFALH